MSNQANQTMVTTGQVRLSYIHLFKPFAKKPGDDPKFDATILVPKSDIATKQLLDAAINVAIQAGVASKWGGIRPPQISIPIHDGDGGRPSDGMPYGDECKGHWVFTASSKQQPSVVDASIQPILNQSEVYSGMYARVNVNFYPYFTSGKKGVGCGLGPVQKLADGEPLAGGISAEAAFGGGASGGYAPPVQQQAYQQPQQQYGQQPVQPMYQQQPTYPQPQQQYAQPQQQYVAPAQPQQQPVQQFDPITGLPITPGGVMGL